MIIEELCKSIIIDEIRHSANASELYFLSCLLGYEKLSLSEDWPGRIYTSQFIYDILLKKKPKVHPTCFRVMKPNVPMKFKSKDKVIWVTMFDSDEMKNNVMFHFDDDINKYLYTGVFNEVSSWCRNEVFALYVQKGIDYVYINTLMCNSNPYICAEDTIDEIKTISLKHSDSRKLVVVMPNFGYEKLLVQLVKAFPKNVYPTKTQRYILSKLGYSEYVSNDERSCRIMISLPGILTESLETDLITIYITEGDACKLNNDYGVYLRQWSPLPSLMDQQILLELIRPRRIISIDNNCFLNTFDLPFNLRLLAKSTSDVEPDSTDTETWPEISSIGSIETNSSVATGSKPTSSIPSTIVFCPLAQSSKLPIAEKPKAFEKENKMAVLDKPTTKFPFTLKSTNLTKPRTRVIRQRTDFVFSDSDSDKDSQVTKCVKAKR